MSKTALSVFLQQQLSFQSPSMKQALHHAEQRGRPLVDSLLEMQLLTQEQLHTLNQHFTRARSFVRNPAAQSGTLPSLQGEHFSGQGTRDDRLFREAIRAVERAVEAPDLLRDLPETDSSEELLSPVAGEETAHSLALLDEKLAQMTVADAWEEEETEDHWLDAGDSTLPQVHSTRAHFTDELIRQQFEDPAGALAGRLLSGTWLLNKVIGEGAMGIIYESQNIHNGKMMAVKLLRDTYQHDEEILNRFCREAGVLQGLTHDNILKVAELGYDRQLGSFMVMELLKGCDLDQFLKYYEYEIPVEELIYVFGQVCDAMEYVHDCDIIHRDLKPENIYLSEQPDGFKHATIIDFGIVKLQDKDRINFTMTGATLGTPQFVSPEQAVGGTLDRRSDIYSLAVIVFKSLAGQDLFEADNPYEYLSRHIYAPAPKLSSVLKNKRVPRSLDKVLAKALSKKKEDRFESMRAFKQPLLEALEEYRQNLTRQEPTGVLEAIKSWGVRVFSSTEIAAIEDSPENETQLDATILDVNEEDFQS